MLDPGMLERNTHGGSRLIAKRSTWIVAMLALAVLSVTSAAPWLLYWIGLSKIEDRPTRATQVAKTEQLDSLARKLRISLPIQIDTLSPYSYLFVQDGGRNASARIVWIIARSYNAEHLEDRRFWHLSGAALTIWLTRNWTPTELIAKAVELEMKQRP